MSEASGGSLIQIDWKWAAATLLTLVLAIFAQTQAFYGWQGGIDERVIGIYSRLEKIENYIDLAHNRDSIALQRLATLETLLREMQREDRAGRAAQ